LALKVIKLCRLDKPVGTMLLAMPCFFGVALCTPFSSPKFWQLLLMYLVGAFFLRSAGCIINDIFDAKYDAKVERTKNRPLACGQVSVTYALFLFSLMILGGGAVWLFLSSAAKLWSLGALALMLIYPLMKRITHWPQLILGLAFNSGVIIACADQNQMIGPRVIITYLVGVCITIAYDTIYAFQDINDDEKVGLKSTAILFKNNPKALPYICYVLMIAGLFWVGMFYDGVNKGQVNDFIASLSFVNPSEMQPNAYIYKLIYVKLFVLMAIAFYATLKVMGWNHKNFRSCKDTFNENVIVLLMVFAYLLL